MKIFLSPEFKKKKEDLPKRVESKLASLIGILQELSPDEFKQHERVKQLKGLEPPLFTMNFDSFRIFTSLLRDVGSDGAILFLDLQEKSVATPNLQYLQGEDLFWEFDALVADTAHDLVNDDIISGLIAETNAYCWDVDDYQVDDITKNDDGTISAKLYFHLSGDQDPERVYWGSEIEGEATVTIGLEGVVRYEVETAGIKSDYDEAES